MNYFISAVFLICAALLMISLFLSERDRLRDWWHSRPGRQAREARRIARQASKDFKRRQRLRGGWFRLF